MDHLGYELVPKKEILVVSVPTGDAARTAEYAEAHFGELRALIENNLDYHKELDPWGDNDYGVWAVRWVRILLNPRDAIGPMMSSLNSYQNSEEEQGLVPVLEIAVGAAFKVRYMDWDEYDSEQNIARYSMRKGYLGKLREFFGCPGLAIFAHPHAHEDSPRKRFRNIGKDRVPR